MAARLKQVAQHVLGLSTPSHPFDPLSAKEIDVVVKAVREDKGDLAFNAITLSEPKKSDMLAWLMDSKIALKPARLAEVVGIDKNGAVWDGTVDLEKGKVVDWEMLDGIQPLVCCIFILFFYGFFFSRLYMIYSNYLILQDQLIVECFGEEREEYILIGDVSVVDFIGRPQCHR